MTFRLLLPFAIGASVAGMALAVEPVPGAKLGTNVQDIDKALSADGYEMTRYDKRTSLIEVHAIKGGTQHVLFINNRTGDVVKTRQADRKGPSPLPGVADEDIRARLIGEGYQITKYERDHGKVEVYAVRDGQMWELRIDPRTSQTMSIEAED